MKLQFGWFVVALGAFTLSVPGSAEDRSGNLQVLVPGLDSDRGKVLIAVFDSAEAWQAGETPAAQAFAPVANQRAEWTFEQLPFGRYAYKLFHDENDNQKLDTNWAGIPRERYGFSNDARGFMGPPDFDAASFRFDENAKHTVKVD